MKEHRKTEGLGIKVDMLQQSVGLVASIKLRYHFRFQYTTE